MDWSLKYNQKEINEKANDILNFLSDELINSNILKKKFKNFSNFEIKNIYRYNLYVAINTFVNRFLKVSSDEYNNNKKFNFYLNYYNDTLNSVINYYNNDALNYGYTNLLNSIKKDNFDKESFLSKNNNYYKKNIFKEKLYNIKLKFVFLLKIILQKYIFLKFLKPKYLHENTYQLNIIFPFYSKLINFPNYNYPINDVIRSKIREIAYNVFENNLSTIVDIYNEKQIKNFALVFSYWIDQSIPISILEGLEDRFIFYRKLINNLRMKSFFACSGFFLNENIKIFSILCKRKKINIIGLEHGVNNFHVVDKNNTLSSYKAIDHLLFSDIFFTWGKNIYSDKWQNSEKIFNTKIEECGSVYLHTINKNIKLRKQSQKIKIFYCASQFRKFNHSLEEIPEHQRIIHKNNVANLIKLLLNNFKNIEIIYKPFIEKELNFHRDPISNLLKKENLQSRIQVSHQPSIYLMKISDIVLFDLISTGFAESINLNKLSFVFSNTFELSLASNKGKEINRKLKEDGIVFYDEKQGYEIISNYLINKKTINNSISNSESIILFKQYLASPISRNDFLNKLNKLNI